MANAKQQKSAGAAREKSGKADRTSPPASTSKEPKLDEVSDAPESGEPRAQGRSRGRIIDSDGAPAGSKSKPASRSRGGSRRGSAADPTAAARHDESGDTANEAWESGRQKAMGGPEE
jgi:hypothetical protein